MKPSATGRAAARRVEARARPFMRSVNEPGADNGDRERAREGKRAHLIEGERDRKRQQHRRQQPEIAALPDQARGDHERDHQRPERAEAPTGSRAA